MISIKCSQTVKPNEPTPNVQLRLTVCDHVKPWSHTSTVYFYQQVLKNRFASAVETLKSSLGDSLVHYYPFAGRLKWIGEGQLEVDCNEMGAEIIEAESEAKIEDYGDFCPTTELSKLVPHVDYITADITKLPILLVQVTTFKCGGMCIGISISHILADGIGAVQFISSWSKIARKEKVDILPFHDRSVLSNSELPLAKLHFDHIELKDPPPLIRSRHNVNEEHTKETKVTMLKLTKEQVHKLKVHANEDKIKDGSRDYSRFEVIAGHIWKCASKARTHEHEQLTVLRTAVDCRKHIKPPLSSSYYGNAITVATPMAKSGDLISLPLGYATNKIRESVDKVSNNDYIRSYMEVLKSQPDVTPFGDSTKGGRAFYGNPNLALTSWLGLSIYDSDFGWGKPIYMGPATLNNVDGKSFIIPGRDEASLIIPICLQVAHMDEFKNFFYQL
ncbi:Spermidine hydroxycinnamoyl transferase [Thalictrum thalictroides]|uniref:Spermidine hydroxycinnamoyl transferase n=1 Tax=Thalictrum thalictroides TaxID=46969 RepID=A0A7J6WJL9_THATH|nr:Spermidine hydroxycinnamoyl transferase [Thalictrum thalictroides]